MRNMTHSYEWVLVPRPKGRKIVSSKRVFRHRRNELESYHTYCDGRKGLQTHVRRRQPHGQSKGASVHWWIVNVCNAMHQTRFRVCNQISLCRCKACVEVSQRDLSRWYHLQWELGIDLGIILRRGLGRWGGRSQHKYITILAGGAVSWRAKKPLTVSRKLNISLCCKLQRKSYESSVC